jgi:hypothetical protein
MGKKLSEPLLSRFRVIYLDEYDFSQFYKISVKQLLDEGHSEYAADEITKSVWEELPNPNIRNCVQIGRLVKNEPNIKMGIPSDHHYQIPCPRILSSRIGYNIQLTFRL